jgi:hypothetical protein
MRTLRGTPKIKKRPPYEFILDELEGMDLSIRRMFGCTAVYVGLKIMLVMYKPDRPQVRDETFEFSEDQNRKESATEKSSQKNSGSQSSSSDLDADVGIWLCIPNEHTLEMKAQFPELRGVSFFENENSAWQCLPESNPDFEELVLKFCKMIKRGDVRIGRLPKPKKKQTNKKPVKKKSPPVQKLKTRKRKTR